MRSICFVLDGKGGVWKSTIAQAAAIALMDDGKRSVEIVDCDTTNALMVSAFGRDATKSVDLAEAEAAGRFAARMKSSADYCVVDVGARDEARIVEMLPDLCEIAAKEKCSIVAFRPITLSSFTQRNAAAFAKISQKLGVKVILIQTRGQGRTAKHYAGWESSKLRAAALSWGAVETWMSDVGVRWADEIPSFGITFDEVARGDFSRVSEEHRSDAEQIFDDDLQAHMGLWLHANVTRFREAMNSVGVAL
jgi:hypothetical protein